MPHPHKNDSYNVFAKVTPKYNYDKDETYV